MGTAPDKAAIYLFGNPLAVWAILVVIALLGVFFFLAQRTAQYTSKPLVVYFRAHWRAWAPSLFFVLAGWLLNLLPYAAINRTTFAYHYMPALVYGNLLVALFVDKLSDALLVGWAGSALAALATGAVWWYYKAWIYAMPLEVEQHAAMRWLPRWN
jgi:dolichyl-phosphate-mannose--protein O-mannosyl transferase